MATLRKKSQRARERKLAKVIVKPCRINFTTTDLAEEKQRFTDAVLKNAEHTRENCCCSSKFDRFHFRSDKRQKKEAVSRQCWLFFWTLAGFVTTVWHSSPSVWAVSLPTRGVDVPVHLYAAAPLKGSKQTEESAPQNEDSRQLDLRGKTPIRGFCSSHQSQNWIIYPL